MPGGRATAVRALLLAVLLLADLFFLPYALWGVFSAGTDIAGWALMAGFTAFMALLLWLTYRAARALIASVRDSRAGAPDIANPS